MIHTNRSYIFRIKLDNKTINICIGSMVLQNSVQKNRKFIQNKFKIHKMSENEIQ